MSSVFNSLYPSAKAHKNSKWPKIETAKAIKKEDNDRLCGLFNSGEWRTLNKSVVFRIRYYNAKDILFAQLSVKKQSLNENKIRYEEINRFRNGYVTQYLKSVKKKRVESLVTVGSLILEFYGGFICENLELNPFENFVIMMTENRNKFRKKKKDLLQTLTEKRTNAVYGFCIRHELNESYKYVSIQWMRTEYDDQEREWFLLMNGNIVIKLQDHDGVDDNGCGKAI